MKTRDAKSTLEMLPHHKKSAVEQQLLRGLLKSRNDYQASFYSIPRNTRLIYLHSYQSYIWNVIVTQRLQRDGFKAAVGDLVQKSVENEVLALPRVEYVTEENENDFTIYDVVLPLPGHGVKYPLHQAGKWYTEELAKDGLTVEMLKNSNRDLSLSGAYRKCVVKPTDVSW
ncbi:pseudouridylate synthase 7 homolog [Lytechinus pictus]|uniref:pseudouridylate synthase 7 homolog n=1 Tax=Lytechinus pictus TaxID=7653 RepID=UPI0030B9F642